MLENVGAPVLHVAHAALKPWSDSSYYKRRCPTCSEGILLVGRNQATMELQEYDHCIWCGQRVRYTDIERMREQERSPREG